MAAPCQPCGVGRSQCHLLRIGGRASVSDIPDVIHFWKTVTLIGRKRGVVDYFLSDATPRGSDYISRIHARVIQASTYELVDSSLTGVYVNDVRIHGRTVLQEGDTVTFGHPDVQNVALGVRVRQPNSPFYFLFERCHCSLDQMPQLPGEFPVLASAETCPEIRLGLGSEMKAALMQRARAAPEFPPARPALSELNGHHRCCRPAAFCTLPPSLAASVQPPVTSSPTINFSSNLLKMPGDPGPGAAPECSVRSRSRIRRSLSPEYAVLEEEMPGATKPFSQGALDTKCGPFIQESPKLTCSDPAGGNEELPAGGRPGSHRPFPRESCTRETGTGPLQAVRHDPLPSSRPASACPDESVAADLSSSPCGPHVSSAELPRDGQELTSSFQVEEGDGPKAGLSPPGAKELVSSGSDHNQEVMKMEVDERTEEAARSDTTCLSEAGSQEQVPEVMEEAVRGDPVTSVGCSGDRGLGEEGTVEGHGQILTEKPFHEAGLQETEWAGDGNVMDISLTDKAPETLDWLSDHQGSRALDDLLCGQEPDGVLPASLRVAKEVDPEALSAAVPSKNQGDGEACEGQSQGNVSEDEGDVEMLSHGGTGLLATGCPLGPREMGSADPEGESDVADHASLGELSFAEVGTQTGGLEEREMSPVMTEAREERGASHNLAIPQHYDNGINTPVAKETLLQQFSEASASDSPAREVSSRREFSGEGAITAAASSGMTQEKSPSEGLLETCQEDPAQVAAAPPSGLGWGKEIVLQAPLEADLQEQLMDLDGEHFEACPSQRSETCPGGGPEGAAAERELECGSTRGAEPDAAAGSRLAACELGHEEEKHDGEDGVAPAPACASLVEPDSLGGHESECQEEMDCDGAAGGGESKAQRGRSVASASPAGTAVGEDGCEKQPERRLGQPSSALQVSCGGADGGPARSPEGGVASSLAGGPPRLLPPSQLGIPPLCAGTPLLFQKSDNGSGGRLQSESSRLLPKQDDTEDEPEANQNNEIQATAQSCSVDAKPIEDAQHRERAELEQNDSQMERWTDCHESHGMPSGPSAQFECQVGPSLPRDCQEPEFRTGELLGLGNNPEVEPQGADAGKGLFSPDDLPVEGSAWEKVGQADVAVECSALSSPKGGREEVVVPEQGNALDPSPQGSSCGEEKGLCLAGSKQSQALQASPDSQVPRQSRADSGAVLESSSSEELDLCKSDSEAEKQENDNSQAHSTCGGEAVIPKERDAFISDSAEHLGGVTENGEAGGKRTEWWATQDQGTAASEETGDGPPKATDMLAHQNSSCGEPCRDLSGAAVAVPQTSVTDVAAGGTSPALVEAAAGGEELEDQAAEGTESLPLNLSCVSEEDSHLLERDAKLGIEDQSPGGASGVAKENGPNLLEESRRLDSRFAGQLGREMLDVGETPEEHVPSEIPAGVCAEEVECGPKTKEIEKMSQSEDRPGCSDWLKRPDWGRSSSPKEEKSEGCSSRKRRSSEDQALGILDGEHDFYGQKRLRPLNSGSDLHASPGILSAPLDLERQFSRTIGKFLQQYSSQITLPSEEAEKKGRDHIAQIVRTYFNGPFGPEELEAENLEVETSALPLEAQMTEGADCESAARSEAERGAAGAETESTLTLNAEPQVNPVQHQDPSLPSECSSSSAPAPSSGSHAQQPGQELAPHIPESAWKAYFSEEEEFQSSISSVMEHPLLSSPVASPKAPCGQEPSGKNMDFVFSDISNSSAESEHGEPPPELEHGSSTGMGSGQLQGAPSGAGEAGLALGGASSSPEPAGEGWCKEESSTPCGVGMSSHESVLLPEADWPVESEDQYDATGEKTDAPVLQQAGSTFDGEGGHKAPGAEAPEQATPPTVGETREELDDSTSRMQIEDGAFLQRNDEDAPSQELDYKPAIHQPSDSTLWGRHTPCVKVEPAPHHIRELFDEEGNASPSRTASVMVPSEPVGCPTVVGTRGKDSMLQSSSLARVTPSLGQARVCGQAGNSSLLNRSCLLRSMKKDGCAKTADVRRKLQSREDGSSLCPLLPRGPAGAADDLREKDFGDGLESDLGRSGAGWAGQMEARSAAQGDVGDVGRRAAPLLTAVGCGNQRPVCSPMLQEDAPVLTRLPSLPSVSCTIKEEPEPCDSHVQVAGFSPHEAYPTSCSPVIPVLQKPRIAEASENWVPESPVGCHEEEAEAPGQLDTACMLSDNERSPCAEAKEGHSSTSMGSPAASDPPPQGAPWSYEGRSSVLHTSASNAGGAESSPGKPWASSEQEVAFQLQECHSVLEEISRSLGAVEGIDDLHMEKWREQIAELQKATKMPSTSIAVVGNTGAGKSSLLNALLDEEAVLPTSAMRACTAVVVEISGAAGGSRYQAEVEFFSKEEWYKELKALLEDMKDKSGNLKRRCPDRKTEAGVAYSRVKAVYGRVDEVAKLESLQDVTQYLGTVKRISAETAAEFRANIEKFIDSRTDNLRDMKGGEFWPIVKCVKIRVAQAEVLKTGVVLVDLPGIRDSNAARDNAAKEYLKNCNAVWVVASITRAVDDKTAKEILNSNLRRQLFMDGQYGNLAFICTKTDSFNISDIVRDLDLRREIQPLEEELEELESQRIQVEEEKGALHMALQLEHQQGAEAADPAWMQRQHHFLEKEFQLSTLQKQKDAKLRAISQICVQARNRFSKQRIWMDFNTGLEELRRKAELSECDDDDGDEDMEDRDFPRSDPGDLGEADSPPEKLHVFTVSSTEYLKLNGQMRRDGPAQVFHDPRDTEIPALKSFAIETGLKTSIKATEKVIRDVARVISEIVHYLTNQRAEDISHHAQAQEIVQRALQGVPRLLQEAADDVLPDIQYFFGVLIQTRLSRGSIRAKELCEDVVKSWGLPDFGFPHATYHAACLRQGVYTSPKYRCVDFNSHLAEPVQNAIAVIWSEVFNSKLEESLQRFTKAVLDKLKFFFRELKRNVGQQSSLTEALEALYLQQMEAVQAQLHNFLLDQEDSISRRQRTISRMLTPAIQAGMEPAYTACSQMSGPGYFQRMKAFMESYVHQHKNSIFDAATKMLQEQLHQLQQQIRQSFQSLLLELKNSLRMQFEPLLKPVQKNAEMIPDLLNICAKVAKICKRSCVEYVLPSATQVEASSPEVGKELRGNSLCFSALRMDIRLGTVPLPGIAAIQVSGQDLALRLTDGRAVALPLRRISLCESCLPLGCLILHVSSESAGEICRRCGVQVPSPGQFGQEALVILDQDQDRKVFSRLTASVSSSHSDALRVRTLSLCQGRERLESLGVDLTPRQSSYDVEPLSEVPAAVSLPPCLPQAVSVVQQPQLPPVNLVPYGKKRAKEDGPALLKKRHKSQAGPEHAGRPLPNWSREGKMASSGQRAASCPPPASGVSFPADGRQKAGWFPEAAPHSKLTGELTARPGSAGVAVRAEEGLWGKCNEPDSKGDSDKSLKTRPVESGKEASPAGSSWLIR